MVEKISGVIKDIQEYEISKKDGSGKIKKFYYFVGDLKLSAWRKEYNVSDYVEIEYEVNGNYLNLQTVKKIAPPPGQTSMTAFVPMEKTQPAFSHMNLIACSKVAADAGCKTPEEIFAFSVRLNELINSKVKSQ